MLNKQKAKFKKNLNKFKNKVKMYLYKNHWANKLKIQKDIIIFESMLGRNYSGNPRAIYEEMVRQGLDQKYRLYWVVTSMNREIPGNVTKVKRNSFQHLKLLCQAKIWVFDTRQPGYIKKNPETIYIMTWHGTPLKKLALDMDDVLMAGNKGIESYKANFWKNSRRWDYLIAQNQFSSEIFEHCFDFHKDMLNIGYPRNDTLVNNNNKEFINAIKEQYGIPLDKKVVLYAPTWRDDQSMGRGKYIFNPHINFDTLKRELGDEYVFIVKYHYLIANKISYTRFDGTIVNIKADIQDLYLISDYLMTDYSSVMFDYSVLDRPMLFYTYDLDDYVNNRGFYFDFKEEAPGPFLYNTEDLVEYLKNPRDEEYREKLEAWRKKYNSWDDGKASSKVVDIIVDEIENPRVIIDETVTDDSEETVDETNENNE